MKFYILASALLFVGCATTKTVPPTCNENFCFVSNPGGRIKSIIYSQKKQFVKDITWVPPQVTKDHVAQGHFEFDLMEQEGASK